MEYVDYRMLYAIRRNGWIFVTTLVLMGFLFSLSVIAGSAHWEPAANLSNMAGRSIHSTLVRAPTSGDLFVAWADDGVAASEEIMFRRWISATRTWLPAENLSLSEVWARDGGPIISFDDQGQGLLVWTRTYAASQGAPIDGYDVLWRAWDGAAWSPETVLLHGASYLPSSPAAFGLITVETPNGLLLFIVWGTGYRTAIHQDGAWSEVTPWTYLDVSLAQVIMDQDGNLHAAAYGENSNQWGYNRWFSDAYYLTYDDTGWSLPLNFSSTDGVADDVGLAFDAKGDLHFLWSDPDSPYSDESVKSAIWERVFDGKNWTPNTEVTIWQPDQGINGFSLAKAVDGVLHLAWSEGILVNDSQTDLDIYYQINDGLAWGPEELVHASSPDSRVPNLVVGLEGAALIWQEGALNDQDVYFARRLAAPIEFYQIYLPLVRK